MDKLDIARWQFGITIVYHYLIVPLTIGLSLLVAGMQTAWVRTGKPVYLSMTRFWGRVLMVNFAMGVVTGIVQEFQFGMAWSAYSRYVGDVFGAPLAMEGIVAFFVESTFLGLWMFGADRLPRRVHLACAWAFSSATVASAYFILAANSWMQHPVGEAVVGGRPRLVSVGALLTNPTALSAFGHVLAGAFAVAAAVLVGIGVWQLAHAGRTEPSGASAPVWRSSVRLGGVVGVLAFVALVGSGDHQGKLMFAQQPMKMAAAEALCHTEQPASFSVFAVGDVADPDCESVKTIAVPRVLSFLAHGDVDSGVPGVTDLVPRYQARYGTTYPNDPAFGEFSGRPINYVPSLPVTYWGFRLMIGCGGLAAFGCLAALWLTRDGRCPRGRWLPRLALLGIGLPYAANAFGWVFTEEGRQPFVVVPNVDDVHSAVRMFTAQAVSPGVSAGEMLTSVIALTALYAVLAGVEFLVLRRIVRAGVPDPAPPDTQESDVLSLAY